jgi:signal transduction histidine kinase
VALEADDARYQAVNLAAANWLGLAAEEVVGQLASTCGPRTLVSPIVQACAQAATRAEPVRIEHAAPDAQSEMHHFVTTVARLPANRAAARPFCVITEDVTAAVQMRGQLQLADRLASLGTLAAGVAHEVNNPLSYVRSNLDFLIREVKAPSPSAEEIEGALKEAHDGVERVVRIVRDLKTLSHPNEHDTSVVDALEAVRTAVRMATAEVQRQARLRTTFEPLPLVRGGGNRLVQVILNLLVNAAQAIPPGSSSQEHEVRVHTTTDARGWAQIEVSDTGAGIPEAVQRKIFDPFFTTKPMGVGTGLGLSICHGIITQLGGALTFRSEVGHGTTFRVVLPPADVAP